MGVIVSSVALMWQIPLALVRMIGSLFAPDLFLKQTKFTNKRVLITGGGVWFNSVLLFRLQLFRLDRITILVSCAHNYNNTRISVKINLWAANGLGAMLARKLSAFGCSIVLWDVDTKGLERTERETRDAGSPDVRIYVVDLCNRDSVFKTARKVSQMNLLTFVAPIQNDRL